MANGKQIVIDADVVIHLYKADRLSLLIELYSGRLIILDIVLAELRANKVIRDDVERLLALKVAQEMAFPSSDPKILQEYNTLTQTKGRGESACLAVCRHQKDILASSNLADIKSYCSQHGIQYLTTMDIFSVAHIKGLITLGEADSAIQKVIRQNSKLPVNNLKAFLDKEFDRSKCDY